jgi:hypothetical protein
VRWLIADDRSNTTYQLPRDRFWEVRTRKLPVQLYTSSADLTARSVFSGGIKKSGKK